jgi:hypothetical protein
MRLTPGLAAACSGFLVTVLLAASPAAQRSGLTHTSQLAAAYDAILDADFQRVPALLAPVGGTGTGSGSAPPAVCHVMDVVSRWWQLQGDPLNRQRRRVRAPSNAAIAEAEA